MSSGRTYLVTGANRGIGRGLVAAYLSQPQTLVIAAVRDRNHGTSQSLSELPPAAGSKLVIIQLDVGSNGSITEAVETLKVSHSIHKIDVVISCAGIGEVTGKLVDTPLSVVEHYINVNAYGPLELFRAALPLLRNSQMPKFCIISSIVASNSSFNPILPTAPYNASKLLVTHFARWLAFEVPEVITWSMHPGMVATDMGAAGLDSLAKLPGIDKNSLKLLPIKDAVEALRGVIASATKETTSGHFLNYDGTDLSW